MPQRIRYPEVFSSRPFWNDFEDAQRMIVGRRAGSAAGKPVYAMACIEAHEGGVRLVHEFAPAPDFVLQGVTFENAGMMIDAFNATMQVASKRPGNLTQRKAVALLEKAQAALRR